MQLNIYIDGNNLHRAAKELGFDIDYKKFRVWLSQKYSSVAIYLFIGLVPSMIELYKSLQESGFILIFKETISVGGAVKGNCDAEMVLKITSDFYTKSFTTCILITGDGDFGCLVKFLMDNSALNRVISPNQEKCSVLLRNKFCEMTFLNNHYKKFSNIIINEKAPDADSSA